MCFPVFLNISKKLITQLQNPRYIFLSATVTACFLTVDVKVTQSTAAHIIRYHYVNIIRKGVSSFIMLFALAMIFIQCYLLMGNRRQDCAIFIHSTYLSKNTVIVSEPITTYMFIIFMHPIILRIFIESKQPSKQWLHRMNTKSNTQDATKCQLKRSVSPFSSNSKVKQEVFLRCC